MTAEEQVKLIYPKAKIMRGWATYLHSKSQVQGIKIGKKWLVHDGHPSWRGNRIQDIWELGWRVIQKKMLRQFES